MRLKNKSTSKNKNKKNQSQPVLIFKTCKCGHKVEIDHIKGKLKKQQSKILNKKYA
jgi:hypothetical protein